MNRSLDDTPQFTPPSKVALFLAGLVCLTLFTAYNKQASVLSLEAMPRQAFQEGYLLPNPSTLNALSLGHNEVMADLIWIRALSYFGVHFGLDRDYQWLDNYIETIIALDPNFHMIYQWAGVVTMYGGQEITNQAVMASNRFLQMGVDRFPDEWLLSFMLGCNYRFELQPDTPEQAAEWRLLGATHLQRAAELPDAPTWLALTASHILGRYGEQDQAATLLAETFLTRRILQSGTLDLSLSLMRHNPDFGQDNSYLRTFVSAGLQLRRLLPSIEWFRLLEYQRRVLADTHSEVGFLVWPLRLLTFGDVDNRIDYVATTPADDVFHPTLEAVYGF